MLFPFSAFHRLDSNDHENQLIHLQEQEQLEGASDIDTIDDLDKLIEDEWTKYITNLAWESIEKRFKKNMQKVFQLHSNGKTYREIAEECDLAESSVRMYVSRIREHLKNEIDIFRNEFM